MAASRGRGFAMVQNQSSLQTQLRRPGQNLTQKSSVASTPLPSLPKAKEEDARNAYLELCDKLESVKLSNLKESLDTVKKQMIVQCNTAAKFESFVDILFGFGLKSKEKSHFVATFCDYHGDVTVEQIKLRTLILRKLQNMYKEKSKSCLDKEKFILEAGFACEVFHHVRIDGLCIKVLSMPILDYLGMLIEGASRKEVEVFIEQFPKLSKNLKEIEPNGFDLLISKIRKQIVYDSTTSDVRAMLLEIFEQISVNWKPLDQNAKLFYESHFRPVVRICD